MNVEDDDGDTAIEPVRATVRKVVADILTPPKPPAAPRPPAAPKPNGNAEPAAVEGEPARGMSKGVQWALAGLALGIGVLALIRFPLR